MKRLIPVLFLLVIVQFSLQARGADDPVETVNVRLVVPSGATLATIALLDEDSIVDGYDVELEIVKSADLIAARIISGEADFAVIPSNLAAVLANKGTGIRLAGPAIWGLLYIVTSEDLDDWDDLRGRQVSMIGRGLTPDILFRHLLEENGLDPDEDLEIVYASSAAELAPTFLTGRSTVSMMPEPMITTVLSRKPDTRILVDIQAEWRSRYGSSYPQASLIVAGDFAERYPEYTRAFIDAFSASVTSAVNYPEKTGEAVADLVPELHAEIITQAVPRMNLGFVSAAEARTALEEYFSVLEAFNPASIGGKMPTDDFYLP
jgi:NitT/TauT family transport system substrate-binding protein